MSFSSPVIPFRRPARSRVRFTGRSRRPRYGRPRTPSRGRSHSPRVEGLRCSPTATELSPKPCGPNTRPVAASTLADEVRPSTQAGSADLRQTHRVDRQANQQSHATSREVPTPRRRIPLRVESRPPQRSRLIRPHLVESQDRILIRALLPNRHLKTAKCMLRSRCRGKRCVHCDN